MRIISGIYKRRMFDVPKSIKARPTTDFAKENLFNVLTNIFDLEDITALDLFAGTGAISYELLSRGAEKVICVEKHSLQNSFIKKVISELKTDKLIPIKGDVFKFIETSKEKFDFIFADPPYDLKDIETIPELILKNNLLKDDGILIVEHGKTNDFSAMPEFDQLRTYGSVNFSFFSLKKGAE